MFETVEFDEDQQTVSEKVNALATELHEFVENHLASSRETSLALTNLEQAVMWANRSIAVNGV